jgi:uncharacterized protein YdeI (YjbR/CyaY-like superfamily)
MPTNPRVDAYIEKSPAFAQPILKELRKIVHSTCPEATETIKWGHAFFEYRGLLCNMAAFKGHCAFGFWKGSLVFPAGESRSEEAMGQFGRIASLKDLPPKTRIAGYVRKAMQLNEDGVTSPARARTVKRKPLPTPKDLAAALKKNVAAKKTFASFSPSQQRDYIEWITEAKTDETRARRVATTVEWLAEGKSRNWKYEKEKS